jgi:hypothetical protein
MIQHGGESAQRCAGGAIRHRFRPSHPILVFRLIHAANPRRSNGLSAESSANKQRNPHGTMPLNRLTLVMADGLETCGGQGLPSSLA